MEVIVNKLDEINNDEMLIVCSSSSLPVMTKEDFLDSTYYLDGEACEVCLAEKDYAKFNWDEVFERMEEEQYEDWSDDFESDLSTEDWEILNKAQEIIENAIKKNPTYWESNNIVYKVEGV